MRVPAFPLVASFVLLAGPAFAQGSSMTGNATQPSTATQPNGAVTAPSSSPYSSSAASNMQSGNSTASNMPSDNQVSPDTQQKLKQSLEQTGFRDVVVTPSSYIIHAMSPDGSRIVMLVSPDQMQAVIEHTGSSSQPGGWSQPGSSSNPTGGSTNSPNTESGTTH
jgi:hypothetical protein